MVRLLPLSFGILVVCWSIAAEEPKTKEKPKLPYERLLKGDDAKKAEGLLQKIQKLEQTGKYADAVLLVEELFTLRRTIQGEDHFETVDQRSYQEVLKKLASLSKEDLAGWRKVYADRVNAQTLEGFGAFATSLKYHQEYQSWCSKLFGETHSLTAGSYIDIGMNLNAQAKYAEADPFLRKSLELSQKAVGEEHPLTALSANNVAYNLNAQGKYREAQPLYEKALEIRRKVFGDDHPETAMFYSNVGANLEDLGKAVQAEPFYRKSLDIRRKTLGEDDPDTATSYNNLASSLHAQGKYSQATPLYRKALQIYRTKLGEQHYLTGIAYNNVAENLTAQAKHEEARPLFQKALEIRRKAFGEEHPQTAQAINNFACALDQQAKYAEAQPLYQKAMEIRRKVLGEEHPDTANSYHNVAFNLDSQAKYGESQPLYQKALAIRLKALGEQHPDTAQSFENLAFSLDSQAKYAEAEPLYQKALAIKKKVLGEEHPNTALTYNNLAHNLKAQGKNGEAQKHYQEMLRIYRKVLGEEHPQTAVGYSAVAAEVALEGKYAESQSLQQKALAIRRKAFGEEHPHTLSSYDMLALNLCVQKKYSEAQTLFLKSLDIKRRLLGEEHPDTASTYSVIAYNLYLQGQLTEAIRYARQAVQSYEAARLQIATTGLERANFGAEYSPYRLLAVLSARLDDPSGGFEAIESDLARGLLDEFRSQSSDSLTPIERQQRSEQLTKFTSLQKRILFLASRTDRSEAESKELARIVEERKTLGTQLAEFAAKISQKEIAPLATIQKSLAADTAILAWVDLSTLNMKEHWGCLLRHEGKPIFEPLASIAKDQKWNAEDAQLPKQLRERILNGDPLSEIDRLRQQLFAQRLAPLEKHLSGIKHLYVIGVQEMSGIPIESLTDKYSISYIPSGTFLVRTKDRPSAKATSALLLGDPAFSIGMKNKEVPLPPSGLLIRQTVPQGNADKAKIQVNDVLLKYGDTELKTSDQLPKLIESMAKAKQVEVTIWREGKTTVRTIDSGKLGIVIDRKPAPETLAAKRKSDQMLASLRGDWGELPGTAVEIDRLKSLLGDKTQILIREDATEQNLDDLRKTGLLKQFRYLHFATHGQANDVKSFESALILSPRNLSKESRIGEKFFNGELSAKEVLDDWKLDAELVTLSACESALGRKGGGDGLLGFAQAFLKAGSRSVCLSLWKVDDCATALLMDRFYQNLLGKREGLTKAMPKALALQEAKNWLKNLTLEKATQLSADMSNGVARGKEKGVKLAVPKAEAKSENPKEIKPFEHPRYWAAFILIGDPN